MFWQLSLSLSEVITSVAFFPPSWLDGSVQVLRMSLQRIQVDYSLLPVSTLHIHFVNFL